MNTKNKLESSKIQYGIYIDENGKLKQPQSAEEARELSFNAYKHYIFCLYEGEKEVIANLKRELTKDSFIKIASERVAFLTVRKREFEYTFSEPSHLPPLNDSKALEEWCQNPIRQIEKKESEQHFRDMIHLKLWEKALSEVRIDKQISNLLSTPMKILLLNHLGFLGFLEEKYKLNYTNQAKILSALLGINEQNIRELLPNLIFSEDTCPKEKKRYLSNTEQNRATVNKVLKKVKLASIS